MKRLAGVSFVLLCLFMACPAPCAEPDNAQVQGAVHDARGGEPLARVEVVLEGTSYRGVTDVQGQFEIRDVKPGDYRLRVSTVGYKLVLASANLTAGETR